MSARSVFRGPTVRAFLKSYLLVGLVLIGGAITLISLRLTREVDEQAELTTQLLASFAGDLIQSAEQSGDVLAELDRAIETVAFPFVLTDVSGRPLLWNARQIGVPLPNSLAELLAQDPRHPSDERVRVVLERVASFDRDHPPLPVRARGSSTIIAYVHYGESTLSRRLTWLPWLEAALILAFMGVALVAFRNLKRSEERSIWVGMAKETAHQMGTPLTSMSGWLALLQEQLGGGNGGVSSTAHDAPGQEVLIELDRDHKRLAKVSARFSQIGSRPKLVSGHVDELVANACQYFRRRLPHLGSHVELREEIASVPPAPINPELMEWAFENIIKNALDAIDKEQGIVRVHCYHDPKDLMIYVTVEDNGKGMPPAIQRRIFQPGFSTRSGGWGLGLVLVRRIIQEYHGGSIEVARSIPGEGTKMEIRLKTR